MQDIVVYTDGASRGNPGKGGWAAVIVAGDRAFELAGAQADATNNQMELLATIKGLGYVRDRFPEQTTKLHADSAYVLNGIERWLDGWERNGWMTVAKKPVENKALWKELLALRDAFGRKLQLVKVEGHAGEKYNERVDTLAVDAALGKEQELFAGSLAEYEALLKDMKPKPKKENKKTSDKAAYSYVSLVNGSVHVDHTWAACEKRVKGAKGAKFKKVFSKQEETDLVQDYTLASLL
jgi:ribonuclease HI